MSRFNPDQPLEARLKQVRLTEKAMYLGQALFLMIAMTMIAGIGPFGAFGRTIGYIFGGIAIFQFFLTRFFIAPYLTRKAHENLPSD